MRSRSEASARHAAFGPEGGKRTGAHLVSPGVARASGLGPDLRPPQSGEGEGGLPDSEDFQLEAGSEQDEIEGRRAVLWGCEGRPGTPADEKWDVLDYIPHLNVEAVPVVQQMPEREAWGIRRHPSPESCVAEPSATWADTDPGPNRRGAPAPSGVEAEQASASPLRLGGHERGGAWVNQKRGTNIRRRVSWKSQRPSTDPESSDEFSERPPIAGSSHPKDGGQAKSNSPKESGDTARHSNVQARESFLHMSRIVLTSASRGLMTTMDKQDAGEQEPSFPKRKQSVVWGKGESRPSHPEAAGTAGAAAVAAAAEDLPRTSPRKKAAQDKKPLGITSRVILGRAFPPWGQRIQAAPLEPATFPPVSGIPLLGSPRRYSVLPSGPKLSRQGGPGKRPVARRIRESQPLAREDNDPNRDLVLQAQGLSSGAQSHQHAKSRVPAVQAHRTLPPHAPAKELDFLCSLSGDQEPPMQPPVPERQQRPSGEGTCLRCQLLQKEIEELKEQLAIYQSLTEKF
ncbi:uncharacterized protein CXorf49 homolog [Castor canadensis]|uniref:Uncharacterized protein CXorf49 homolog n=1 Tax=Castor canadensis TaxID=51338 RepID=A0AC58LMI0_CASCN